MQLCGNGNKMVKQKEFKSPTQEPVRLISDNLMFISWVQPTWTLLREELWKAAYAEGCISKDMNKIGADPTQAIAVMQAQEKAYEAKVKETMISILEEGDLEAIDAQGRPRVDVIGEIVGTIPSASLRNRLFKEINNER